MPKLKDITNVRYGRLVVTSLAPQGNRRATRWNTICDCGNTHIVSLTNLRNGNVRSCGCLRSEVTARNKTTHGLGQPPGYNTWCHIKARCNNKRHPRYKDYGGRGITVCNRWLKFKNFFEDMGPRPEGMTIERVNNELGYTHDNCVWADYFAQASNTRRNRYITCNGETLTYAQWDRRLGSRIVLSRLKNGWSETEAVSIQKGGKRNA